MIIQKNIFLSLKVSLNNLLFEKYLKAQVDHPAFLRFLTKKSFSLVRTSSLDFSNSFLISGFKSFFVSFGFIGFGLEIFKFSSNHSDPKKKLWIVFS